MNSKKTQNELNESKEIAQAALSEKIDLTAEELEEAERIDRLLKGLNQKREIDKATNLMGRITSIVVICLFTTIGCLGQVLTQDEKTGKYGFSNGKEIVIPYIYDQCYTDFSEGLICVGKDNLFGYIDERGKEIIPFIFQFGYDFYNGLAWVCKNGKWGVIDNRGKEISPFKYDGNTVKNNECNYKPVISDNMIITRSDNMIDGRGLEIRYGFDDINGNEMISPQFDEIRLFVDGVSIIRVGDHINGKYGIIRKNGSILVEPQYDFMTNFRGGTSLIGIGSHQQGKQQYGIINTKGNIILSPIYLAYRPFADKGYALKNSNGDWSVFDLDGKKNIDYGNKVDDLGYCWHAPNKNSDFYANWYVKNGLFGLLGQDGEILTMPIYEEAFAVYGDIDALIWNNGILEVKKDGKFGCIDKSGKEVIPVVYQNLSMVSDDWDEISPDKSKYLVKLIPAKLNDKWGFIDLKGNVMINFQYFEAENFDNSSIYDNKKPLAKVVLNDENLTEGYIDEKGNFNKDENELRQAIQP